MRFTYHTGQRPLDGYEIKRGIGRGGFGEVYFALSEGGKEVALKLLREHEDVELRGVAHCLNLKHPHLVHLYDLKIDNRGDHWIVMENVVGESLADVLKRHPNGLPEELILQWFVQLAQAINYLHDQGIVHRDVKPGNVFLENGSVKVGDYGLSKSMSGSRHKSQTQSIGTAHYMAPEISTGNYNKSVDVYACGVILYEMLTGHVPFDGENAVEVLFKHRTDPPDLREIPERYLPIVTKALCKNPAHRYSTTLEIVRDVEKVTRAPAANQVNRPPATKSPAPSVPKAKRESTPETEALPSTGGQVGELTGSMALVAVLAVLSTALWAGLSQNYNQWETLGTIFFLSISASWAILIPTKCWKQTVEESWPRRLILLGCGALVGLQALWLSGWVMPQSFFAPEPAGEQFVQRADQNSFPVWHLRGLVDALASVSYFAIVFLAMRWWKVTERTRPQRFSFGPVLATAFWAVILLLIWRQHQASAVALVMASAIVQVVSPWEKPRPRPVPRLRLRYA